MADRDEIIDFLDDLLDAGAFEDYGPNGLQVPGAREVAKVVTGVSAQLELFERAARAGAQLVLCHHGLFWDFRPAGDHARPRAPAGRSLFEHDISLAALPPAARRPPRGGQQRADLRGARARARRAVRRGQGPAIGLGRAVDRGHPVRRVARGAASRPSARSRFVWDAGPEVGAQRRASSPAAATRPSPRRSRWASTPSSPASRGAHDGRRARGAASTSSRAATTPRRRSACGASASCWRSASRSCTSSSTTNPI